MSRASAQIDARESSLAQSQIGAAPTLPDQGASKLRQVWVMPHNEDILLRAVLRQHGFEIGEATGRLQTLSDSNLLREAQLRKDAIRAYELVYRALGAE